MPPRILDFAEAVLRRPSMYTLLGSPAEVVAFLVGFVSGRAGAGGPIEAWNAFQEWLAEKLNVSQSDVLRSILSSYGESATDELLRRILEYRALDSQVAPERKQRLAPSEAPIPSHDVAHSVPAPGTTWRVLARRANEEPVSVSAAGTFDELVVDHWLHIEQMEERTWWFRVGDARLMASVDVDGRLSLDVLRGFYDVVRGTTDEWIPPT
ncbi:MAG: hypothetical protein HOW73_18865 [Polyangiaceae bacterium]|nr:hypothetical protein [Polyangiaceae bacterium]